MRTTMRLRAAAALLSSSMESRPDQCLQPSRDERGLGLAKVGLAGKWKQFQGKLLKQWGKLTGEDLDVAAGRRDQIMGKVQERCGVAKDDKAGRQLKEFEERYEAVTKYRTGEPPILVAPPTPARDSKGANRLDSTADRRDQAARHTQRPRK